MSNTYTSKPYLMIAQGVLNQIDTISSSDDYPLHFYGLTLNNDLIDLGVLTNRKLKVNSKEPIGIIYYTLPEPLNKDIQIHISTSYELRI